MHHETDEGECKEGRDTREENGHGYNEPGGGGGMEGGVEGGGSVEEDGDDDEDEDEGN